MYSIYREVSESPAFIKVSNKLMQIDIARATLLFTSQIHSVLYKRGNINLDYNMEHLVYFVVTELF